MTKPAIRVALADDDPMVRAALRRFLSLEPDLHWAGDAADGLEAIALVQRTPVDLLLLDVAMPHLDGLSALPKLRAAAPHLRILMLSGQVDAHAEAVAQQRGALGFLHKGRDPQTLVSAIRAAMASHPGP